MNEIKQTTSGGYRIRVPQIVDVETAIRIYYERTELSTEDIKELFGGMGYVRLTNLKSAAREEMRKRNTLSWNANHVNTEVAFEAWGLNIADLEARLVKLTRLKLRRQAEERST